MRVGREKERHRAQPQGQKSQPGGSKDEGAQGMHLESLADN